MIGTKSGELGLRPSSPSRKRMLMSGADETHQRDSRRLHAELWMTRIVTPPEGKLVAGPVDDNCRPPALD